MARVFFSYSHDDEQYRDQLEKHLATLRHQGLIESWHDRRILAGSDFAHEIDQQLDQCEVILLLVSASFIASSYCYGLEMRRALERHAAGTAHVVPVIVRPCDWHNTPLGKLLAAPRDGKPIVTWSNYDEAYADVARQVRAVVEQSSGSAVGKHPRHTRLSAAPASVAVPAMPTSPRSSNLRLRKEFTDADQDHHLHQAFDFLAQFFDSSLQELQQRHTDIKCGYRRIDANTFTATIYRNGARTAECAIILGGGFRQGSISFSYDASARGSSFNESLSVAHDDQSLYLKPLGMSMHGNDRAKLTFEQAAEMSWGLLISRLQ